MEENIPTGRSSDDWDRLTTEVGELRRLLFDSELFVNLFDSALFGALIRGSPS